MYTDVTPPQLVSISLPEVIDLGAGNVAATFSVTATDNVAMNRAVIWFDSPLGYAFSQSSDAGSYSLMIVDGACLHYASGLAGLAQASEPA